MKRKLVMLALLTAGVAQAQAPDATTVNLIRLLVEQGVLEAEQADALLRQAQQQAAPALTAEPGDVRVPYIPENVREEITASLREQVIAEAERDGWAAPGQVADWTRRIKVDADVRLRDESRFMGDGNDPYLVNYHRFNQEGPQDMSPAQIGLGAYPPFYNTTRDRTNLIRVRARLGVTAMLSDHWEAGLRLATGSSDDPVSTNQTLGGGLEKKDFWLDRGYIRWRSGDRWSVTGGRFATPFLFTDMLYSNDLNLDGLAVGFDDTDGSGLFATLGAFPLEYTSDDSPSRSEVKQRSKDKWLFGAQVGARFQFSERNSLLAAASFYEFDNISGERSAACSPCARRARAAMAAPRTGRARRSCRRATPCSCCVTSRSIPPIRPPRRCRSTWAWPPSSSCSTCTCAGTVIWSTTCATACTPTTSRTSATARARCTAAWAPPPKAAPTA